jgi:hypothetical protein
MIVHSFHEGILYHEIKNGSLKIYVEKYIITINMILLNLLDAAVIINVSIHGFSFIYFFIILQKYHHMEKKFIAILKL